METISQQRASEVMNSWSPFHEVILFGDYLCIGCGDVVYFVNLNDLTVREVEQDMYFGRFYEYHNRLFVASGMSLSCYDENCNLIWKTEKIAIDIVITCYGINLPLACKARFAAFSIPPQQGTSIRTMVKLLISLFATICAGGDKMPVSVMAIENSEIMLLDCKRIITTCSNSCQFHDQLIYNLMHIVARKNLMLNQKMEVLSKRTTREKIMTYLLYQAKQQDSSSFTIPYDRQGLVDYLSVERSAMSAEISKLRKEGILECKKNYFKLLKDE